MKHDLIINPEIVARWKEQASWQCEICGCTEFEACEGGCYWVSKNLCSNCRLNTEEILRSDEE